MKASDCRLYINPDGTVLRRCPDMGEHQELVDRWIKDSNIAGEYFDETFFFSNKADYDTLKLFL